MDESLKIGDTVQVLKSGKLYRLKGIDSDGPYFQQWRPDRMDYYGPSFVLLKQGRYKKIEASWPAPQEITRPAKRKRAPKPPRQPKAPHPDLEPKIAKIESQIQEILDNSEFVEHLKSYPWPNMGLGAPPSMSYTAHDHLVVNMNRRMGYYLQIGDRKGYLSTLANFLTMMRHEQLKYAWER